MGVIMQWLMQWNLPLQIFVVLCLTGFSHFFWKKSHHKVAARLTRTANLWDDTFWYALVSPISLLIWLIGASITLELLNLQQETSIFTALTPARDVMVIFCFVWFFIRFIKRAEHDLLNDNIKLKKEADKTTVEAISKILRVAIVITGVLVVLQTLGYSISGVLAFGGLGGVVVGFAAKDLLANFFGGLIIYFDRPFAVGDWIRSPDRNIEGTVEAIGWRQTCIRTFDKRPLYVPNAIFSTIAVENPSRMTNRRIYETIGLRYEDANKVGLIVSAVKEMLQQHPEIDTRQTMIVNVNQFAPYSIDFFVYTFTKTINWIHFHHVKQDILLKIIEIVHQHDADLALPSSSHYFPESLDSTVSLTTPELAAERGVAKC